MPPCFVPLLTDPMCREMWLMHLVSLRIFVAVMCYFERTRVSQYNMDLQGNCPYKSDSGARNLPSGPPPFSYNKKKAPYRRLGNSWNILKETPKRKQGLVLCVWLQVIFASKRYTPDMFIICNCASYRSFPLHTFFWKL